MLLSKTVKVKWNSANKKWYESKNYIWTKQGDEFEVNVKDLNNGSHSLVKVKCDNPDCKNPYLKPMEWRIYLRGLHKDGSSYCKRCAKILYGKRNEIKTRIKNGKSFEQWCIENNRQDVLNRWDYDLNIDKNGVIIKPNEITFSSIGNNRKGYWFRCGDKKHKSELKNINDFTFGKEGSINCNQCNSFAQYLINTYGKNALDLYWDYEKNNELRIDPWEVSRCSNKKNKIWIKCQEKDYHGSYEIRCSDFYYNKRCPYCSSRKVHPLDSLGKLLEDKGLLYLWSNKNKKSPYEYMPNSEIKVWWECLDGKHDNYKRSIVNSNKYNFRCPQCTQERDESFLQEKVRLYLINLGYETLHEYNCVLNCINPKTSHILPYDNEIKELKLIIEVHGLQHYQTCIWTKQAAKRNSTTPEHELHMQQVRDRYKRIYAKSQGYHYLEIPCWTDNKEKTWKQLIDNKIKEILEKVA